MAWRQVSKAGDLPSYDIYDGALTKSDYDNVEYQLIRLGNGMQVVLASDAKAEKAGASLSVAVGQLDDPIDMAGLAHFCEHLSFMGSEKYPDEKSYMEFITAHGGYTNAGTDKTDTNYYFACLPEALEGALDRQSQLLHKPLFSVGCTMREINNVHSEFMGYIQQDGNRIHEVHKFNTLPSSRWHKFGVGCLESLIKKPESSDTADDKNLSEEEKAAGGPAGRETRRRVVEWWEQQYCASRMGLCIVGKEPIEKLIEYAVKYFSPVLNRHHEKPFEKHVFPEMKSPWGPEHEGSVIFTKTIMDFWYLDITWVVPVRVEFYRTKPLSFLAQFFGHRGPRSIYSILLKRGWATYVSSGSTQGDSRDAYQFFYVGVSLTKAGWENWYKVVEMVHKYAALIRESPLSEEKFKEFQALGEINFRFKEKRDPEDLAANLSGALTWPYAREDIMAGQWIYLEWKPEHISEMLSYLRPGKARVMLDGRECWDIVKLHGRPAIEADQVWRTVPYYKTEFVDRRLVRPGDFCLTAEDARAEGLELPDLNPFVPTDFSVDKIEVKEPLMRPHKIMQNELCMLWYKKDDEFLMPRGTALFRIQTPVLDNNPRHVVLTQFFIYLVSNVLTEELWGAGRARLTYNVWGEYENMFISVYGYNHKLLVLLKELLDKVRNYIVDVNQFEDTRTMLRQELENANLTTPGSLASREMGEILWERRWTPSEQLTELTNVTVEEVQKHVDALFKRVHIESMVYGNLTKEDAFNCVKIAKESLRCDPLPAEEVNRMRAMTLPNECNLIYDTSVINPDEPNSALCMYIQVGDKHDWALRAQLFMFCQLIREPIFDTLRTKELLGYSVSSGSWTFTNLLGLNVAATSEKDPGYVEARVEAFLVYAKSMIETMEEAEFERHRKSLIDRTVEKFKNLGEETDFFWGKIDSGFYNFDQREVDAKYLREVTREDILKMFDKHISPLSPTRSKFSTRVYSRALDRKFGIEAHKAFISVVAAKGVSLVEGQDDAPDEELPLQTVKDNWLARLKTTQTISENDTEELMELVDELATKFPAGVDNAPTPAVRTALAPELVKNKQAFKNSLEFTPFPKPLYDFRDF